MGHVIKLRMPLVNSSLVPLEAIKSPKRREAGPSHEKYDEQVDIGTFHMKRKNKITAHPDNNQGKHEQKNPGKGLGRQVL